VPKVRVASCWTAEKQAFYADFLIVQSDARRKNERMSSLGGSDGFAQQFLE
jgi:hypothetical protein